MEKPTPTRAAAGGGSARPRVPGLKGASVAPAFPAQPAPVSAKVVAALLAFTGLVTVLYWILYFFTGSVQAGTSAVYIGFENSFPLADGWMALACFLGAAGLWRRHSWGLLFGLAAGSANVFLGLMDVLFNLENGMYAVVSGEMAFEILINVWTLGFGVFLLWFLWTRRHLFADFGAAG